jgi:hypothetical protein
LFSCIIGFGGAACESQGKEKEQAGAGGPLLTFIIIVIAMIRMETDGLGLDSGVLLTSGKHS